MVKQVVLTEEEYKAIIDRQKELEIKEEQLQDILNNIEHNIKNIRMIAEKYKEDRDDNMVMYMNKQIAIMESLTNVRKYDGDKICYSRLIK